MKSFQTQPNRLDWWCSCGVPIKLYPFSCLIPSSGSFTPSRLPHAYPIAARHLAGLSPTFSHYIYNGPKPCLTFLYLSNSSLSHFSHSKHPRRRATSLFRRSLRLFFYFRPKVCLLTSGSPFHYIHPCLWLNACMIHACLSLLCFSIAHLGMRAHTHICPSEVTSVD